MVSIILVIFVKMVVKAAGYVIYRKNSNTIEFLLLQASYPNYHWSPPKGHVDPGENESETAIREVKEESGLTEGDLRMVPGFEKTIHYLRNGKPKSVVYWLTELIDPNHLVELSHEHKDFKWVPLKEAFTLYMYPGFLDLLKACNEYLTNLEN